MARILRLCLWFSVGILIACVGAFCTNARASSPTTYVAYLSIGTSNNISGCKLTTPTQETVSVAESACRSAFATYTTLFSPGSGSCHWTLSNTGWAWASGDVSLSTQQDAVAGAGCDSPLIDNEVITLSCPNGGVLGTTYPDYCVVNGQPPPPPSNGASDPNCQAAMVNNSHGPEVVYTPAGSGTANTNDIQPSDIMGSGANSSTPCAMASSGMPVVTDKAGDTWWQGYFTGDLYSGSTTPAGSMASGGTACASSGSTSVCETGGPAVGTQPQPGQGVPTTTIGNSNIQLPGGVPDNSCVTTASGSAVCAVGAQVPNNGATPPAPATPDTTIQTASPSSPTASAPGPQYTVYGPGTISTSSNFGSGKSATSTSTTTTTTCVQGGTCTTATTATTAHNATTYATPAFPAGTSPNASIAAAGNAILTSPLVVAASGAIAQSVPAGACPNWSWTSSLFNKTFSFSEVCTLATSYQAELSLAFTAMWVVLGAIIILSS